MYLKSDQYGCVIPKEEGRVYLSLYTMLLECSALDNYILFKWQGLPLHSLQWQFCVSLRSLLQQW
jgi:hypothetical protein